jgi:hypothetical protein
LPIRFDAQTWGRIDAVAARTAAEDIATSYRANHTDEVAHLEDAALLEAVLAAQARADVLGLTRLDLYERFMMLDVFRAPGFWQDPVIAQALHATSGDANTRFGDVCGMLRLAALRAGRPELVWW